MRSWWRAAALAAAMLAAVVASAAGQAGDAASLEALKKTAPQIYIDCSSCDLEFIKTEITFVNYVRDRKEAEVHVLITTQATAGGGTEYTLTLSGQNAFAGLDDVLTYVAKGTDTSDETRRGIVRTLQLGLLSYVGRRPIAGRIGVGYGPGNAAAEKADRWNSWLFNVGGSGYFNGQESTSSHSFGLNFSASRVTPDLKIRLGLTASFERNRYTYEGEDILSTQESYASNGLFVKSLGEHWSAGFAFDALSSTYQNVAFSLAPAPAVEFNVFPYSQSTRRQLRILYKLSVAFVRYRETTIYDKLKQTLLQESLSVTLDVKEKWGSVTTTLAGSHYFYDLSKNNLGLLTVLQLNVFKGFNALLLAGGQRVHDQLSLVKGDATLEEIILRRRQMETTYSYFAMVGVSYTFGSIFTNVVNPRFGSLSSGGMVVNIN